MFWDILPQFMAMGMTPQEFWYGDPKLAKSYIKAYEIKLDNENTSHWLNGIYTMNAFSVVIGNAFGRGGKSLEYFKKPIEITKQEEGITQSDIDRERLKAINYLTSLKESWDRQNQ